MGAQPAGAAKRQPDDGRGQEDPAARAAGRLFSLRQDGPVRRGIDCELSGGKFGPFAEAAVRRRPDAQHGDARLPGKGQRPLSGRLLPVPRRASAAASLSLLIRPRTARCSSAAPTAAGARAARKPYSLERLVWTGKMPFEIHEMRAKPDGFELTFTKPVDPDDGRRSEVVQARDVHLHLPGRLRQPRGRPHDADDHEGRSVARTARACGCTSTSLQEGHVHELHLRRRPLGRRPAAAAPAGVLHAELHAGFDVGARLGGTGLSQ